MARGNEFFEVDDLKFRISHYPVKLGLELFNRVGRVLGKSATLIFGALLDMKGGVEDKEKQKELLEKNVSMDSFGEAVQYFFHALTPDQFSKLAEDLMAPCLHIIQEDGTNRPVKLEDFSGKFFSIFKVLAKVLAYQYGFLPNADGMTTPAISSMIQGMAGRIKTL